MKWISIEEEKPPFDVVILIRSGNHVDAGWATGSRNYPFAFVDQDTLDSYDADANTVHANAWIAGKVTHWMPLPAAPKQEK